MAGKNTALVFAVGLTAGVLLAGVWLLPRETPVEPGSSSTGTSVARDPARGESNTGASAPAAHAASRVSGRVTFEGNPPPDAPVDMRADPKCAELNGAGEASDDVRVRDAGLADVLVYVERPPPGPDPEPPIGPALLDQVRCRYTPKVLALRVGQPLTIVNSDPTLHNIHPRGEKNEFNVGMPTQGQRITRSFKKAEPMISVKCDVHPWMKAWIGVFDHPYFAVTGEDGRYTIPGLPDGTYELVARHGRLGEQRAQVTLQNRAGTADFTFRAAAP